MNSSSYTDSVTLILTMASFTMVNLSITWNNLWNKTKLCLVLNDLMEHHQGKIVISWRQKAPLYGIIIAMQLKLFLSSVGLTLIYVESNELSTLEIIGSIISSILLMIWLFAPLISFIIIIADISFVLIYWFKQSCQSMDFQECQQAIQALKKANNVLSGYLFPIICMMLLGITTNVYAGISIVFKHGFASGSINIMSIAYAIFFINYIFIIYYLNNLSFSVLKEVDAFREAFVQTCQSTHLRMIWTLDAFKGFDCSGFFVLGRPLFTSITATFMTYVIILIQFKLAEK